jgi:uracil-DNA glycosylase family 4
MLAMKRVNGVGPLDARIAIIGEAPGRQEEAAGVPFVGGAGQLLDSALLQVGIDRRECFVHNILPYRPPDNDLKRLKEIGISSPFQCLDELIALLAKIRPNVVIALGNLALEGLTSKKGIMKWRGSILEGKAGLKVVPSIHPAMILRQYEWRPIFIQDLKRCLIEARSPKLDLPKRALLHSPTYDEVMFHLPRMNHSEAVAVDIELMRGHISCIGFADSADFAICVPFDTGKGSYWSSSSQEEGAWRLCAELIQNPNVKKIIQNALFELSFLGGSDCLQGLYWDTMVASHVLYPEFKKSLDFLTSIYTREPYYKDEGRSWRPGVDPPEQMYLYNCKDCAVTFEIAEKQIVEMKELGLWDFFTTYKMPLLRVLSNIQDHGLLIDTATRDDLRSMLLSKISSAQAQLNELAGWEVNVNSPKAMQTLLYKQLRLPVQRNRATGSITTDQLAIDKLMKKSTSQLLPLIGTIRRARKIISTYLDAQLDSDGRIRTTFNFTETGRLTSSNTVFGTGMNLQNWPHADEDDSIAGAVRDIIIADAGTVFVEGDSAQAEAIAVAGLSGDGNLLGRFQSGKKVHPFVASLVFGKPEQEVGKGTREYDIGKRCVHSGNYKVGPRKFAQITGLSEAEASRVLELYYQRFPGIPQWHERVERELHGTRTIRTPFGRQRRFFGRWGDDLVREAIAYVPQSTVVDNLNRAMLRCYWRFYSDPRIHIVMQIHDSMLVQCPPDKVDWVTSVMKKEMERQFLCGTAMLVIPAEFKTGPRLGSMKEIK